MSSTASPSNTKFDLFDHDLADPYPYYDHLRSTAPVFWEPALRLWVLTRYEDVRAVLYDETADPIDIASSIAVLGRKTKRDFGALIKLVEAILFFQRGERHKRDRRSLGRVLTRIPLSELEPIIDAIAGSLAAELAARERFDFAREYAEMVPALVISHILGLPATDARPLVELSADLTRAFDAVPISLFTKLNRQAAAGIDRLVERITQAVAEKRNDGLTLIHEEVVQSEKADLEEAAALAFFAFIVAMETTSALIASCVYRLLRDPDLYRSARENPALAEPIVAEVTRLECPVQRVVRIARRAASIGGQEIKEGDRILLLLGAANRDPAAFARSQELDASRGEVENVAFGGGKHFCLGTSLARLEARVALGHILRMPHALCLAGPQNWYAAKTIRRITSLPVQRAGAGESQPNDGK